MTNEDARELLNLVINGTHPYRFMTRFDWEIHRMAMERNAECGCSGCIYSRELQAAGAQQRKKK